MSPLIAQTTRGGLDLFEPIIPTSLALFVMFFLRPLADQASGSYNHLGYDISDTFDKALMTSAVGCLAISAGYMSRLGFVLARSIPTPRPRFPQKRVTSAALLLALLAVFMFGYFLTATGGAGTLRLFLRGRSAELELLRRGTSAYLADSQALLMPASLLFLATWCFSKKISQLIGGFFLGLPYVVIQTALGNRSTLLPFVLGAASIVFLSKKKRPPMSLLICFGALAIVGSSYLREHRDVPTNGTTSVIRNTEGEPMTKTLLDTFTSNDNEMFDSLANIIQVYPSRNQFRPLSIVTDVLIRAIPRTVFKDKPLESADEFIVTMWPEHYRVSHGSAAISILGAFYIYGGNPAVVVLSFALGVLLNGLWHWYRKSSNNINVILVYAFVPSLTVILLRGSAPDTIARMFFTLFPILLAIKWWAGAAARKNNQQFTIAATERIQRVC
jgi:oligosaccharide repeat unit polymerase